MEHFLAVIGILGVLAIGTMSPGPSLVVVARTAIAQSRPAGLAAALGMGVGGFTFGLLALAGLQAVLQQVPWLYTGFKLAGGLYLLYLAWRMWRGAAAPMQLPDNLASAPARRGRPFLIGLATQVSNPKTAIVYGSVFAALLPAGLPLWTAALLLAGIFLLEAGWYGFVAVVFSAPAPRNAYLRSKRWVDRAAGCAMGALGLRLIWDARREAAGLG